MKRIHRQLARFKIGQKMFLSSGVAALPIAVLLYFMVTGYSRGIANSENEIAAARDLQGFSSLLTDLRLLQSWKQFKAAGIVPDATPVSEPVDRIDARIAAARLAPAAAGETVERLDGLWKQFRNRGGKMTPLEASMTFRLMIDAAGQLCNSTSELRLLALDSGVDSYYLIKAAGPLLLQAQTAVARARLVIQQANSDGELTQRDLATLQLQGDLLSESLIPMLQMSLDTAIQEDEKVRGSKSGLKRRLAPLAQGYLAALTELASELGRFSSISDIDLTSDQILRSAAAAESKGTALWQSTLQELVSLLEDRLAGDRFSRAEALLLSFLSLILASGAVFIVTRNITNPLERVVSLTTQIAAGHVKEARERLDSDEFQDLLAADSHGREPRDETYNLLRSMAAMTDSLNALLAKVSQACNQVASSATLTAETVHDIESAVSEQAASTHQVTATSRQIYSTVQDLAQTMQSVTRTASSAARKASEGMDSLEGIRAAAAALMEATEAVTRSFEAIQDKTGNIDRVITEITKIANRTNLLSLNAAIEAEKAGELAGGFSIVALEVRKLADQTAVAALDIERRIHEMQDAVRDGLSSAGSYTEQARASTAAAAELSAGLAKVIERTTRLGPEFESVNQGMQVQSQGAGQIAESMQHLRDAAANTKSSLADFRRVEDDLHRAVSDLKSEVGRFSAAS